MSTQPDPDITDPRTHLITGLAGTRWAAVIATWGNHQQRAAKKIADQAIRDIERREGAFPADQRQAFQVALTIRLLSYLLGAARVVRDEADAELRKVPDMAAALQEREANEH